MRPAESFIEQPIRSLQTMLQIIAEDNRQLPTVIPDGIYGPTTMNSVTAFQRIFELPITGITDQNTWDKIVEVYEDALIRIGPAESIEIILEPGEVFQIGDSNPYIYLLQSILIQLSKDNPSISPPCHSGVLDNSTSEALAAFQVLSGLPATGVLDKKTWKYLSKQFTLSASKERLKLNVNIL